MNHSEKLQVMYKHLPSLGIPEKSFAPRLYKILWRLGIPVPPPVFAGFFQSALLMGSLFALGWGTLMWLALWWHQGVSIKIAVIASISAGALFGISMGALLWAVTRKYNLPPWSEYKGE